MIQIDNLDFGYTKHKPMFQQFNLSLQKGKIYGLLGKNGMGKTTLLKQIAGFLHPKSGGSLINDTLSHLRKVNTMASLYFLPEQIASPAVNIPTFLKMNAGFYPNFDEKMFYNILTDFELEPDQKLNQLSHGQQKKVAIAFGLAVQTEWLLLDEPTNGLDIPSKVTFRKVLSKYIDENRGIIISTHQILDIEKLIEDLVVIDNGKLILNQSLHAISEKLEFKLLNENIAEDNEYLYSESFGIGTKIIDKNNGTASEGALDLETLFNALVAKNQKLTQYLNA